jgi:formamidopyrimidine-DNA glycosylase
MSGMNPSKSTLYGSKVRISWSICRPVPELPEVETVVRSLQSVAGRRIQNIEVRQPRILRGTLDAARGKRITSVRRRGKFIVFDLNEGHLLVHLGMTGKLLLDGEMTKHTHAIFTLDRGVLLYTDSRQFGRIEYAPALPERVEALGPEPLLVGFDDLYAALHKRKTQMKALLLNQRFLAGIGNIYADEALFRAGIHPRANSAALSKPRARKLYTAIQQVLAPKARPFRITSTPKGARAASNISTWSTSAPANPAASAVRPSSALW